MLERFLETNGTLIKLDLDRFEPDERSGVEEILEFVSNESSLLTNFCSCFPRILGTGSFSLLAEFSSVLRRAISLSFSLKVLAKF